MKRLAINPWPWSLNFGFNQAELIEGHRKELICAGQTATDEKGQPQHANDMAKQLALTLDNLNTVLKEAEMDFSNLINLRIYTRDMDETMKHYAELVSRLSLMDIKPPISLIGVHRLALPELLIEVEARAVS